MSRHSLFLTSASQRSLPSDQVVTRQVPRPVGASTSVVRAPQLKLTLSKALRVLRKLSLEWCRSRARMGGIEAT